MNENDTNTTAQSKDSEVTEKPRPEVHPIARVIQIYLSGLRDISQTLRVVMPHLAKWLRGEMEERQARVEKLLGPVDGDEAKGLPIHSTRNFVEVRSALRELNELARSRSLKILLRSLFMQMFCEFDAFTGNLLKAIYDRNPKLLRGVVREITLAELLDYETIDAARSALLSKEIETFRRDSYVEQFSQLEKKFGLTLRKFSEWSEFVELSQRRNILTHNDGVVNEQYLLVCDKEGTVFQPRPKVGDSLQVDMEYLSKALLILSRVGFMLGHTLWMKVFPKEREAVQNSLHEGTYSALENKRWKAAVGFGEFSISETMRKDLPEKDYRIAIINYAIALKFSGREEEARQVLNSLDWSASYRDFKLAILVLTEDYQAAVEMMELIGREGELISQLAYHSWPLFHAFRERPEFYATYERIYGEQYREQLPADTFDLAETTAIGEATRDCSDLEQPEKKPATRRSKKPNKARPNYAIKPTPE